MQPIAQMKCLYSNMHINGKQQETETKTQLENYNLAAIIAKMAGQITEPDTTIGA